jgi:RNA-binding protein 25
MGMPLMRGPPGMMVAGPPGMMMAPPPGMGMAGIPGMVPPPPGTVDISVSLLPETGPLTVFVGKFPPDIHDNYIRQLLDKCGTVLSWKRTMDPVTNKPKGFGYCTFAGATDVLRALRLLNGFSVDSKEMLVKADSKTQAKLDEYAAAMTEKMRLDEKQKDEESNKALKALFDERSGLLGGQQNHPASWGELLGGSTGGLTDGNSMKEGKEKDETKREEGEIQTEGTGQVRGQMILSEIEKFRLAQDQRDKEMEEKRRQQVRDRLRKEQEEEEKRKRQEAEKAAEELLKEEGEVIEANHPPASTSTTAVSTTVATVATVATLSATAATTISKEEKEEGKDKDNKHRSAKDRRSRSRSFEGRRHHRSRSHSPSRSRGRSSRHRSSRKRSSRKRSRRSRSASSSDHSRSRSRDRKRRRHRRSRSRSRSRDHERKRKSSRGDDREKSKKKEKEEEEAEESTLKNMPKIVLSGFKMSTSSSKKDKQQATVTLDPAQLPTATSNVFKMEDEVETKPKREIVPIKYTAEELLATAPLEQRVAANLAKVNSNRNKDVSKLT